ncbi:MAG: ComEA family DNA-binding protein [Aurantibacter sp.]
MKNFFKFNKRERSGIFFLLLIIILLQIGYYVFKSFPIDASNDTILVDTEMQAKIDLLKEKASQYDSVKIYPFNPNFITDFKGYTLGMSADEIDRLQNFRKTNKYVNSPEEFQKVTQVSDSFLKVISPYFKFPEWTKNSKQYSVSSEQYLSKGKGSLPSEGIAKGYLDLNSATADDLKSVSGIGEKLSARIIKFRDRLGGFLVEEQLNHVYGLEPQVVERTLQKFKVLKKPDLVKININSASEGEMVKLVYINYDLATKIIAYRDTNGRIATFNELTTIEGFPSEKLDIIELYLSLN